MSDRDRFEVWAKDEGLSVTQAEGDGWGNYSSCETFWAWQAWQAAQSAQEPTAEMIKQGAAALYPTGELTPQETAVCVYKAMNAARDK